MTLQNGMTPLSDAERERTRRCLREHRVSWRVVQRHGNASAFNGYRWTPSDYSGLTCLACGRFWRTKAAYVATTPDKSEKPHNGMNEDRDIPRFGADETGPFD